MNHIVVGLGFGDEGKGLTTDYLALQNPDSVVVRFNGGHQAGHTVMTKDGRRHVFSNFGAGSLRGNPTYWSRFCTTHPKGFLRERKALVALGVEPKIYVDALSPVTTPWDIAYNKTMEIMNGHGSVGVGFGATLQREEDHYHLQVQDLKYKHIRQEKIRAIQQYYEKKKMEGLSKEIRFAFLGEVYYSEVQFEREIQEYLEFVEIINNASFYKIDTNGFIFEGAQGTMLDMDYGFFPNVTRSNTTVKNAITLLREKRIVGETKIIFVTRAYQTRHGNGWMSNMDKGDLLKLKDTEGETNITGEWQGNFRRTLLDIDLLKYAVDCNRNFSIHDKQELMVTCVNQIDGDIKVTNNGEVEDLSQFGLSEKLHSSLNVRKITYSHSPYAEDIFINV